MNRYSFFSANKNAAEYRTDQVHRDVSVDNRLLYKVSFPMTLSTVCHLIRFVFLLLFFVFILGCAEKKHTESDPPPNEEHKLELISAVNIQVDEPSRLCFSLNKKNLWTVSDKTGKVYKLDFNGNVLKPLS